jgi:hypothetical protein
VVLLITLLGHVVHIPFEGFFKSLIIISIPIYTALTPYIAYEILKRLDDEST